MALAATSNGEDADMRFIINMLVNCGELSLDSKGLAKAEGIAQSYNVFPKIRRILKQYGCTYDSISKRVQRVDGVDVEGSKVPETPKKSRKSKEATTKTTPSKKRKLSDTVQEEEEQRELVFLDGPVMRMETTPGFELWENDDAAAEGADAF